MSEQIRVKNLKQEVGILAYMRKTGIDKQGKSE